MRFGTADQARRGAIVSALRAHGARVVPGPVDGVCEVHLDTEDPLAAACRKLVACLDLSVPGWRCDATLFCTADRTHRHA
jgi:hypothetical protein